MNFIHSHKTSERRDEIILQIIWSVSFCSPCDAFHGLFGERISRFSGLLRAWEVRDISPDATVTDISPCCPFLVITILSSANGEDLDLTNIFKSKKLNGTIVISSLDGTQTYIQNEERANKRFLPASTFKIPNTLIALEEGAVADEKEIIKWDGKDKGLSVRSSSYELLRKIRVVEQTPTHTPYGQKQDGSKRSLLQWVGL